MAVSPLLAACRRRCYCQWQQRLPKSSPVRSDDPTFALVQDAKRDMRSALSRSALLGELRVKKVIDLVPEEVRQIHGLLEAEFNPLQLCKQLAPLIEKLSSLDAPLSQASPVQEAPLAQYQQALRQVCLSLPFVCLSMCFLFVCLACCRNGPLNLALKLARPSVKRAACPSGELVCALRCHRAA
jgi:hypothetical protein